MEERVSQLPDLGYEVVPEDRTKVAVTTLAFKNQEIISFLRERGLAIRGENWDEMRKIDQKINELKDNEFERITTPCSVFMTFETEEGYNRAIEMDATCKANPRFAHLQLWMEKQYKFKIKEAAAPSDIIWENRHYTDWDRTKKAIVVWTALAGILFANSIALFILTTISNNIIEKFPPVDCATLEGFENETWMEKEAIHEYSSNTWLEGTGIEV